MPLVEAEQSFYNYYNVPFDLNEVAKWYIKWEVLHVLVYEESEWISFDTEAQTQGWSHEHTKRPEEVKQSLVDADSLRDLEWETIDESTSIGPFENSGQHGVTGFPGQVIPPNREVS